MAQATVRELKPGGLRPQRYRNAIVPHIYAEPAAEAVAFYARAFGTTELFRIAGRDGKIIHAEIAINGHDDRRSEWQ